jgi:hypothetical protein
MTIQRTGDDPRRVRSERQEILLQDLRAKIKALPEYQASFYSDLESAVAEVSRDITRQHQDFLKRYDQLVDQVVQQQARFDKLKVQLDALRVNFNSTNSRTLLTSLEQLSWLRADYIQQKHRAYRLSSELHELIPPNKSSEIFSSRYRDIRQQRLVALQPIRALLGNKTLALNDEERAQYEHEIYHHYLPKSVAFNVDALVKYDFPDNDPADIGAEERMLNAVGERVNGFHEQDAKRKVILDLIIRDFSTEIDEQLRSMALSLYRELETLDRLIQRKIIVRDNRDEERQEAMSRQAQLAKKRSSRTSLRKHLYTDTHSDVQAKKVTQDLSQINSESLQLDADIAMYKERYDLVLKCHTVILGFLKEQSG